MSGGAGSPASARRVVLALGSNLGDRMATLQGAVDTLSRDPSLRIVAISPVYETAPVGGPEQGAYLNAVVAADCSLRPRALLELTQGVEQEFYRVRAVRWGPRTLDIDILDFDAETSDDPVLTLPHPRAHERAFVLRPWSDIDPDAVVVGRGTVRDLLGKVADQELWRRSDLALRPPE
ncbi:2-amino-4-hydroxy-6-hydroxymethyldihydropteridine diphosphokinase [Nocardiopsis gilva YIM 90087]|uniref:2-amino-4-hydroxy-6-hydroxymethyldihydropteridine diphosphokinase n=1 Tax=Nocardiopsis gilva YIM 90087 TaxID=1235441 RepID=A0A223SCD8_9ACTN|nr:2-amino-4-hydroxy-6-hydroxymethyldihydropteridine diphosphokinase [Nocardiopsis gilva]ASU85755.1 2-amino-4-hydroxy-6-hydroxymethyldihydropteridine diphosphokinase [Nocardiopsis gilva YIM 90087]